MNYLTIIWDADEGGNVSHIAEHGLTTDDVAGVIERARRKEFSAATGRPCVFGHTDGGEYIIVIFEEIDADTIYPVTAYEVPERK